jgi:hypothetical protein
VFSASQACAKLVARDLAEGDRDIMLLLHATIRKHDHQGADRPTAQEMG